MSTKSIATARTSIAIPPGVVLGLVGVACFSLTLPLTRIAIRDLSPLFAASARAVVAAGIAIVFLRVRRAPLPGRRELLPLAVIAGGVVAGFPICSAYAMQTGGAGHGGVVVGLLPLATAAMAVLRSAPRPGRRFWVASLAGAGIVAGWAAIGAHGVPSRADGLMVLAVIAAAIGYAEGARVTIRLGAGEAIAWSLVLALPVTAVLAVATRPADLGAVGNGPLAAFAYTAVVSMFLGFLAWYRGLATGGTARIGQLQLLQPTLTVGAAWLLLGEPLRPSLALVLAAVAACVIVAVRARA